MPDTPPENEPAPAEYPCPTKWRDTLTLLNQRVEQHPADPASWSNRGVLLSHVGDYDGAARDFNEALRLNPQSQYALRSLARLYETQGRYPEAIATFSLAIDFCPDDPHGYRGRAHAYSQVERLVEAIADFTKAISLDPEYAGSYLGRAQARDDIRDHYGALADFKEFFRLENDCKELIAYAHGLRAFTYAELGLYREAISDLDTKIAMTQADADDYLTRSKMYRLLGDSVRAAEDSDRASELTRRSRENATQESEPRSD